MSLSKKKPIRDEARARAESPGALPIFSESGLVPVEQARKLTPEQAALLREFQHVLPDQVEGESS